MCNNLLLIFGCMSMTLKAKVFGFKDPPVPEFLIVIV
jgi:hypothetical protein